MGPDTFANHTENSPEEVPDVKIPENIEENKENINKTPLMNKRLLDNLEAKKKQDYLKKPTNYGFSSYTKNLPGLPKKDGKIPKNTQKRFLSILSRPAGVTDNLNQEDSNSSSNSSILACNSLIYFCN